VAFQARLAAVELRIWGAFRFVQEISWHVLGHRQDSVADLLTLVSWPDGYKHRPGARKRLINKEWWAREDSNLQPMD